MKDNPIAVVGKKPEGPERTFVIFGMTRGGTSMVAGVAARLRIDLGKYASGQYEDARFNIVEMSRDIEAIRRNIRKRNLEASRWGWKDPLFAEYGEDVLSEIRNPCFIAVYRDAFASQGRRSYEDGKLLESMSRTLRIYSQGVELISSQGAYTALVSYERAIREPERFLEQIAGFVEAELPEDVGSLIKFMKPGFYKPPSYEEEAARKRAERRKKEKAEAVTMPEPASKSGFQSRAKRYLANVLRVDARS